MRITAVIVAALIAGANTVNLDAALEIDTTAQDDTVLKDTSQKNLGVVAEVQCTEGFCKDTNSGLECAWDDVLIDEYGHFSCPALEVVYVDAEMVETEFDDEPVVRYDWVQIDTRSEVTSE